MRFLADESCDFAVVVPFVVPATKYRPWRRWRVERRMSR
jgi:hypothetical protein